jgi:hypothetical protein
MQSNVAFENNPGSVELVAIPRYWTFLGLYECKEQAADRYNGYSSHERATMHKCIKNWVRMRDEAIRKMFHASSGKMVVNVRALEGAPGPITCQDHHTMLLKKLDVLANTREIPQISKLTFICTDFQTDPTTKVAAMGSLYVLSECGGIFGDYARLVLSQACHDLHMTRWTRKESKDGQPPVLHHASTVVRRIGDEHMLYNLEDPEKAKLNAKAAMLLNSLATILIVAEESQREFRFMDLSLYLRGISRARLYRREICLEDSLPLFFVEEPNHINSFVNRYISPLRTTFQVPNECLNQIIGRQYTCEKNISMFSVKLGGIQRVEDLTQLQLLVDTLFGPQAPAIRNRINALREAYGTDVKVVDKDACTKRVTLPYVVIQALPFRMAYEERAVLSGFSDIFRENPDSSACKRMSETYALLTKIACVSLYRIGMRFAEFTRLYRMKDRPDRLSRAFGIEECALITFDDGAECELVPIKKIVTGNTRGPVDLSDLVRSNATVTLKVFTNKQAKTNQRGKVDLTKGERKPERILRRDVASGPLAILPLLVMLCMLNHRLFPPVNERTEQPTECMTYISKNVDRMTFAIRECLRGIDGFTEDLVKRVTTDTVIRTPFAVETLHCCGRVGYNDYFTEAAACMNHTPEMHKKSNYAEFDTHDLEVAPGKFVRSSVYRIGVNKVSDWREDMTSSRDMFVLKWLAHLTPTVTYHRGGPKPVDLALAWKITLAEIWRIRPAIHEPVCHNNFEEGETEATKFLAISAG